MKQYIESKYKKNIIVSLLIVGGIIIIFKSFMGLNFGDEIYHLALMRRFSEGAAPFYDEWHPTQIYGIFMSYSYGIYVFLTGSSDGIIISFRILMNLITISIAAYTCYVFYKQRCSISLIIVSLISQIFYATNGTLGMTYYMLSYECMLLAILICNKITRGRLFFLGVLLGIVVTCNPVIFIFYIIYFLVILFVPKYNQQRKNLIYILLGTIIIGLVCFHRFIISNVNVINSLKYIPRMFLDPTHSLTDNNSLWNKLFIQVKEYFFFHGEILFAAVIVTLIIRIYKKEIPLLYKKLYFILQTLYMLIIMARCIVVSDNLGDSIYVFGWYVICILPIANIKLLKKNVNFIGGGLTLLVSYIVASDQGRVAGSTGSMLLLIGSIEIINELFRDLFQSRLLNILAFSIIYLPILLSTIYWKVYTNWGDKFAINLPNRITQGPASGLYVSDKNKNKYMEIYNIYSSLPGSENDTLIANNMMAYLVANKRCGTYSVWCLGSESLDERVDVYLEDHNGELPNYIVVPNDDLETVGKYKKILIKNIYRKTKTDWGSYYYQ